MSKPQPIKGIEVHEVEPGAPVHEGFDEPCHPNYWADYERKPSQLGDAIQVIRLIKSDRGLGSVKAFQGGRAYNVDCPVGKFELMSGLVGSRPPIK
jgi:hypothetical protein